VGQVRGGVDRLSHDVGGEGVTTDERTTMSQLHLRLDDGPRFTRDQEFLTIAEAAALARCCQRTIRRAIDAGQLRAARLRGKEGSRGAFRIARIDLEN